MTYCICWTESVTSGLYQRVQRKGSKELGTYGQKTKLEVEQVLKDKATQISRAGTSVQCFLVNKPVMKGLELVRVVCNRTGGPPSDAEDIGVIDFNAIRKVWYTPWPCMVPDCKKATSEHAGYAQVDPTHTDAKTLGKFGPGIILYVSLEGYLTGRVGCHCRTHRDDCTGKDIVDILIKEGLDPGVTEIRLWVCRGAEVLPGRPESFLAEFTTAARPVFPATKFSAYLGFLTVTAQGRFSYVDKNPSTPGVKAGTRREPK